MNQNSSPAPGSRSATSPESAGSPLAAFSSTIRTSPAGHAVSAFSAPFDFDFIKTAGVFLLRKDWGAEDRWAIQVHAGIWSRHQSEDWRLKTVDRAKDI